jgi:hypothetical protein
MTFGIKTFGIATFGIATFGIATFGIMTFGIMKFGITKFGITTLSRMGLFATLSINDTQYNSIMLSEVMLWVMFNLLLC